MKLSTSFSYDVLMENPTEEGMVTEKIPFIFYRKKREELNELRRIRYGGDTPEEQLAHAKLIADKPDAELVETDLDFLLLFVKGWNEKKFDINGESAFNRDQLRILITEFSQLPNMIYFQYLEANGGQGGRKGN